MTLILKKNRISKIATKPLLLHEFCQKRHKVLVVRDMGGLGDILMHRMMFEDFKKLMPECHLTFACPKSYHTALHDHPFLDAVADSKQVEFSDYMLSYNTSSACVRYEIAAGINSDWHRSDIWANHCGIKLTNHEMHLTLEDEFKEFGKQFIKRRPAVVMCPISTRLVKDLNKQQIQGVATGLQEAGYSVIGLHNNLIPALSDMGLPSIYGLSIRQWMGVMWAADYVISVDTASLHGAAGLKKPVLGIFTAINGPVYTQWYPTAMVAQHIPDAKLCPCYNWPDCPLVEKKGKTVARPCLTDLSVSTIMAKFHELVAKYPVA